jgi:zinc protease
MSRRTGFWVAAALALSLLAQAAPARAQLAINPEKSPGGLAFRSVLMRDETHQTLSFAWKDGTTISLPGKEALAGLAPALMLEGPQGLSRSAMIEDLRDLQASMSLSASTTFAQGSLTAPPAKFAAAAQMFARMLTDPALPEERLKDAQKNRALTSLQQAQNADTMAQWLLARHIFGEGPYWRVLGAVPSSFEAISKADVEAWRRNVLVRDTLMIVAAGPMAAADIGREIDRIFAGLPQSGAVPPVPKPTMRSSGKLIVMERPVVQTAIVAASPTSLAVTPDLTRAEMAVQVLGRAFTGRLFRAVREKLGAAYGISASLRPVGDEARMLYIASAVANDKAKAALAAIREEYARYVADGVADDEVEPLKSIFITGNAERQRRAGTVAGLLLTLREQGMPDDYLAGYDARVRSYGRAAINADIQTKFPAPPLTFVMVTPSAEGLGADCVIKALEEIARCD